jgi:hypothetical protein
VFGERDAASHCGGFWCGPHSRRGRVRDVCWTSGGGLSLWPFISWMDHLDVRCVSVGEGLNNPCPWRSLPSPLLDIILERCLLGIIWLFPCFILHAFLFYNGRYLVWGILHDQVNREPMDGSSWMMAEGRRD